MLNAGFSERRGAVLDASVEPSTRDVERAFWRVPDRHFGDAALRSVRYGSVTRRTRARCGSVWDHLACAKDGKVQVLPEPLDVGESEIAEPPELGL